MRIVVITRSMPIFNDTFRVDGLYKRLKMMLNAIEKISDMEVIIITDDPKYKDSKIAQKSIEIINNELSNGTKITISTIESKKPNRWYYLTGILSMANQVNYNIIMSNESIAILNKIISNKPDAIFVHRLWSMAFMLKIAQRLPPIFFDLDDVEHITLMRSINQPPYWLGKPLLYLQIPALWWGERKTIKLARSTFVCSQKDADYLNKFWHLKGVCVVNNAIDIPEAQVITTEPVMLFIGGYNYPPNLNAAEYLIERIWPLVHRKIPKAKLIIAGAHSDQIRFYNANVPNVEYPGFVQNLNDLYARTRVVCCPILSGGGTRVKLIEAAAYGKPIVSTTIGAEGLILHNEQEILLRDDPQEFAKACCILLENMARCKALGNAAREIAIKHYAKENVTEYIQNIILGAMGRS